MADEQLCKGLLGLVQSTIEVDWGRTMPEGPAARAPAHNPPFPCAPQAKYDPDSFYEKLQAFGSVEAVSPVLAETFWCAHGRTARARPQPSVRPCMAATARVHPACHAPHIRACQGAACHHEHASCARPPARARAAAPMQAAVEQARWRQQQQQQQREAHAAGGGHQGLHQGQEGKKAAACSLRAEQQPRAAPAAHVSPSQRQPPHSPARTGVQPAPRWPSQVDRKVVMEVLDVECMQAVGLVGSAELWRKKEVRFNTKAQYTVTKWVAAMLLGGGGPGGGGGQQQPRVVRVLPSSRTRTPRRAAAPAPASAQLQPAA